MSGESGGTTRRGWLKGLAAALGGWLAGLAGRPAPASAGSPPPAEGRDERVTSYPVGDGPPTSITISRYDAEGELVWSVEYTPREPLPRKAGGTPHADRR